MTDMEWLGGLFRNCVGDGSKTLAGKDMEEAFRKYLEGYDAWQSKSHRYNVFLDGRVTVFEDFLKIRGSKALLESRADFAIVVKGLYCAEAKRRAVAAGLPVFNVSDMEQYLGASGMACKIWQEMEKGTEESFKACAKDYIARLVDRYPEDLSSRWAIEEYCKDVAERTMAVMFPGQPGRALLMSSASEVAEELYPDDPAHGWMRMLANVSGMSLLGEFLDGKDPDGLYKKLEELMMDDVSVREHEIAITRD